MCETCAPTLESMGLDPSARYAVDGYAGIAFYLLGPELVDDSDTEWTGYQVPTGNVVAVMVGDDREHYLDPSDLTALDDSEYCSCCGQIGCAWG
jgi:hypothetical protein